MSRVGHCFSEALCLNMSLNWLQAGQWEGNQRPLWWWSWLPCQYAASMCVCLYRCWHIPLYLATSPIIGHWNISHSPAGPCQTHPNHRLVVKGILTALWKIFNAPQGPQLAITIIRQTLSFSKTLPRSLGRLRGSWKHIVHLTCISKADNNKDQSTEGGEGQRKSAKGWRGVGGSGESDILAPTH